MLIDRKKYHKMLKISNSNRNHDRSSYAQRYLRLVPAKIFTCMNQYLSAKDDEREQIVKRIVEYSAKYAAYALEIDPDTIELNYFSATNETDLKNMNYTKDLAPLAVYFYDPRYLYKYNKQQIFIDAKNLEECGLDQVVMSTMHEVAHLAQGLKCISSGKDMESNERIFNLESKRYWYACEDEIEADRFSFDAWRTMLCSRYNHRLQFLDEYVKVFKLLAKEEMLNHRINAIAVKIEDAIGVKFDFIKKNKKIEMHLGFVNPLKFIEDTQDFDFFDDEDESNIFSSDIIKRKSTTLSNTPLGSDFVELFSASGNFAVDCEEISNGIQKLEIASVFDDDFERFGTASVCTGNVENYSVDNGNGSISTINDLEKNTANRNNAHKGENGEVISAGEEQGI